MLTALGAAAVTFMTLIYALERRGRGFIFAFGCGCGVVEAIWAAIAFNRWRTTPPVRPAG